MLGKTQQTILANGCRIVTAQMDTVESVSVGIDVGVGSRYEGPGEAGFCHFLEHLVFKGSAKRPSTEALMRPIEAVGGSMNAYTATDHTMFFAKVPFDALPLAGDTLFDLVLHPTTAPARPTGLGLNHPTDIERVIQLLSVLQLQFQTQYIGFICLIGSIAVCVGIIRYSE